MNSLTGASQGENLWRPVNPVPKVQERFSEEHKNHGQDRRNACVFVSNMREGSEEER